MQPQIDVIFTIVMFFSCHHNGGLEAFFLESFIHTYVVHVFVYLWNNSGNTWIEKITTSFKKKSSMKARNITLKLVVHNMNQAIKC